MKPKAFKRQTIKLAIRPNASPQDVERFGTAQALVLGNFAIHNGCGYIITHIPSGRMAIPRGMDRQSDAKDLARRLEHWFGQIEDLNAELTNNPHLQKRYRQLVRVAFNRYDGLK